jgi:hypothetical protein
VECIVGVAIGCAEGDVGAADRFVEGLAALEVTALDGDVIEHQQSLTAWVRAIP